MSTTPVKANARPQHGPPRHSGPGHGPMGGTGERAADFRVSLRRLLSHLRPQRSRLVTAVVLGIGSVALSVSGPKILGHATDMMLAGILGSRMPAGMTKQQAVEQAIRAGNPEMADMLRRIDLVPGSGINFGAVGAVLTLVLALYLASFALSSVQGWLINEAVQRSIYRMRQAVSAKLDRLPLSYFDRQARGEVLSRLSNDIDNLGQSLQQTLSQLVNSLLTVIGVLVMMVWISPLLAVVALLSVPLATLLTRAIGSRSQRLFASHWKSAGELNAVIEEAYTGHRLVKVFGRAREVETGFAERNQELCRSGAGAQFISGIIMPVMFLVGNLNYVVIAVAGGLQVAAGQMNIGDVQAFVHYSRQFTHPLAQVSSMANLMQSGIASAERVFELLDAEEIPETAGETLSIERGEVVFDDVCFSYTPGKPLIRNLSLTVQPGQSVAIVGPTGAGKTTLVNLIMRFYDLDSGGILIDGIDIASVPRGEVRRHVGMVLQDTWLFGGTIRENIAYGRPGASEEEIVAAAKAAFVDRFVRSLPDGYDTVLDEEGSNVSAGEKQLITIARAFLVDPPLLILDEATSSVDTRTELLLQQAMTALRARRTSFIIAHRLSTIRDADLILVMDDGRIVEHGSHAELLERRGRYETLYRSQFEHSS